ncbi:LLM class flavin-dependent oxidoreductase [Rhodococcoides yunnanense]|uniref:LLM class flavin-dependent oxidoreductase n=1 Tax=Rhodococcoides yunnanense TaxID=278209 RepID=UPI0009345C83|nr:LLM class flavin-dependent oxidoreductase [Rhodococcus yunnanensis]
MTTRIEVGVRLPACRPVPDMADAARVAESLGFDQVWIPDSQLLWRDAFMVAGACAAATSTLGIGTAVTNVVTRHPSVVASAARTVAEQAVGRFSLGIGTGNSSVEPIGMRASTQSTLRDGMSMIRTLSEGQTYDFGSVQSRLREPTDFPVLVAATGPKNLRFAGEVADGAILLSGVSESALKDSVELVQSGADSVGRGPIPITASAFCAISDDIEKDARSLKPIVAGIAQHGGRRSLERADIHVTVPASVDGIYPDLIHAEDWDTAVDVCGRWISDADALKYAREFCLFGTAEEVSAGIETAADAGISRVLLQHVGSYDLPFALMESFAAAYLVH